jgi:hypothetical protein
MIAALNGRSTLLAIALIMAIPMAYGLPLVGVTLDNLRMVRHFDHGEANIYEVWSENYSQGPLHSGQLNREYIYPSAFYNLTGVALYPYALATTPTPRAVVGAWRTANVVLAAATLAFLFIFMSDIFRSKLAAGVGVVLFGLSPQFLVWSINVRPNPLEQLLILLALAACIRLCGRFTSRRLLIAAGLGALAFATKFGGLPFILIVPVVGAYALARDRRGTSSASASEAATQLRWTAWLASIAAIVLIGGACLGLAMLLRHGGDIATTTLAITGPRLPEAMARQVPVTLARYRTIAMLGVWGGLAATVFGAALMAWVWRAARERAPLIGSGSGPLSSIDVFLLWLGLTMQTLAVYAIVFFATGPAYLVNPGYTVAQLGYLFYYSGMAGSYGSREAAGYLGALTQTARELPGWFLFVPVCIWGIVEGLRRAPADRMSRDARVILCLFVVLSVGIFVLSRAAASRHILPALAVACCFAGDSVVRHLRAKSWRRAVGVLMIVMLAGAATLELRRTARDWSGVRTRKADIGFRVADWLEKRYAPDTKVLTDNLLFYDPPRFTSV